MSVMANEISNVTNLFPATVGKVGGQSDACSVSAIRNSTLLTFLNQAEIKKTVGRCDSLFQEINRIIQFSFDDSAKNVVVKISETDTGKLIKQFPYIDRKFTLFQAH